MEVWALIAQKGGAGKTTIAIHLAVAAASAGQKVLIVDTDPQLSASGWAQLRGGRPPHVLESDTLSLSQELATAADDGYDLAIIDTAPHAKSSTASVLRAATRALVPVRPTALDLLAFGATASLVRAADVHTTVILSAVPGRCPEADDVAAILRTDYHARVAPTRISERRAYMRAIGSGLAVTEFPRGGVAAAEIRELHAWLLDPDCPGCDGCMS